jgi:hypothetical protein
MNEVRYDAVDTNDAEWCHCCDLCEMCNEHDFASSELCNDVFGYNKIFKKSDKKFEV